MVEKSGVKKFLLALGLKSPGLESSWLKSSWLKSLGLQGAGLKLGVETSGVEMSFNPKKPLVSGLVSGSQRNPKIKMFLDRFF